MEIAIIETGSPDDEFRVTLGGYYEMFLAAFAKLNTDINLKNYAVYQNQVLPKVNAHDGFLITGSPLGVYEDHAFIEPLKKFVCDVIDADYPIVGICFGHQLMAEAMGGKTVKSPKGWGVGVHHYQISSTLAGQSKIRKYFQGINDLSCLVSHQDQVVELSSNIELIAGSQFCANGILGYGKGNGLSFQMHPEFTNEFAENLLDSRVDRIDPDVFQTAKASFSSESDSLTMMKIIHAFFNDYGK